MKTSYRGYEIEVHREKCMGGWENLYLTIMRESDGKYVEDSFTEGSDTVPDFIGYMKERIDAELADEDPWGEKAEAARFGD